MFNKIDILILLVAGSLHLGACKCKDDQKVKSVKVKSVEVKSVEVKPSSASDPAAPPARPANTPDQAQERQASKLYKEAQKAYINGAYARAIKLCHRVLMIRKGFVGALQVMGASHCNMKDRNKAQWVANKLSPALRNTLEKICEKQGITLE